jgi:hypothetical protein
MLIPLLVSLAAAPAPPRAHLRRDDPPIKVWLNNDNVFQQGDRATVKLRVADDGYVIVLRADADGRVRVLYPLDPSDDDFIRGGKTFEVRGRGDRDAFEVDERSGDGTVIAAVSPQPFHFDAYVRGDHWDYRVLGQRSVSDDPEAGLLDIVGAMAGSNHYDYDVVQYSVVDQSYAPTSAIYSDPFYHPFYSYYPTCWSCGYWYPGSAFFFGVGFGNPGYYDPFCWSDPFCGGFRYGYGYGYGWRRPRYGNSFTVYIGGNYGQGYSRRYPFILRRDQPGGNGIGVRQRTAANGGTGFGTPNNRGGSRNEPVNARPRFQPPTFPGRRGEPQSQPQGRPQGRQPEARPPRREPQPPRREAPPPRAEPQRRPPPPPPPPQRSGGESRRDPPRTRDHP